MDDKLLRFFKKLNFNDILFFENASLKDMSINKQENTWTVRINSSEVIPVNVMVKLKNLASEGLEDVKSIYIKMFYSSVSDESILEYFMYYFKLMIKDNPSLSSISENNISIDDKTIKIKIASLAEEKLLKENMKNIKTILENHDLYDVSFVYELDEEEQENVKNLIKETKENVKIPVMPVSTENQKYKQRTKVDYEREGLVTIASITKEENNVNLEAYIFDADFNEITKKDGSGKVYLSTLKISDDTSSILAKCFYKTEEEFNEAGKILKPGKWFKFTGIVRYDEYAKDLVFQYRHHEGIDSPIIKREDLETEKRCELHAHTMMSQMDGVIDEETLVKQAISWGHAGIAITDHDCCQSFAHIFNQVTKHNKNAKNALKSKLEELEVSKEEIIKSNNQEGIEEIDKYIKETKEELENYKPFKIGYGVELEMIEDFLNVVFNPNDELIEGNTFVVFDTETTGFNPGLGDSMIEIGGVKIKDGEVIDRFDEFINPGVSIDPAITKVTDISDDDVKDADNEENVVKRFKEFIGSLPLVAHNARFDKNMLDMAYYKYDLGPLENPIIDTLMLSRIINRDQKKHSLKALGKLYGIDTGEEDEEQEESVDSLYKLEDEINEIESIKIDGEEVIKCVETKYQDADIATEKVINKTKYEYYLNIIRISSKTESVRVNVIPKEGITLIDFNEVVNLHPAENIITINYMTPFGEKSIDVKVYVGQHHGADVDSENTGYIFSKMLKQIEGIKSIRELNDLKLLEEISFKNDPKKLKDVGYLISYKNYIRPLEEGEEVSEKDNPLGNYGNNDYAWKFKWCCYDKLQMYENIPSKTFNEHLANIYDLKKHITFISLNKTGLKNLFKIISFANTNFLERNAKIPRALINNYREGLLVGSACSNGEIFDLAKTRCDEDLCEAMKFYDYIEIQPIENYKTFVKTHEISNMNHLKYLIKKIIKCAKSVGKIVVATGDVHNLDKKDLLYREIIVNQKVPGKGMHPLAKYLNIAPVENVNLANIDKNIKKATKNGVKLDNIDKKILKIIYVISRFNNIKITAKNINELYVEKSKENIEDCLPKEKEERIYRIESSLRKLTIASIVTVNYTNGEYTLNGNYNDKNPFKEGHIPNQYFRTTKEMLDEFAWLESDELIKEIVITNPNKIMDMIEVIEVIDYPLKPYSPIIENSQEIVRDLVYEKAFSMYGNPLPKNIEERIVKEFYGDSVMNLIKRKIKLDKPNISDEEMESILPTVAHEVAMSGYDEVIKLQKDAILETEEISDEEATKKARDMLGGIIGGGFDVIYLIAQKLVKHSNDEGYLVGSRGSVGSSIVATMMGITECNGLPAHYYCPECCYSEFNDSNGIPYSKDYPSGFDLPLKNCPKCETVLVREGNDMPFATFLGFNAEKVPDIDLNFSGDNQASAHEYTKVLFGTDNVYRAGTIGTVASKTAYGFVQGFFEEQLYSKLNREAASYGITIPSKDDLKKSGLIKCEVRTPEIERLSVGCTGVKRTTGQHPGGIVVVPDYKDVWDFTPFQYPADDNTANWRTTHFDYHAIDADLLKLDILGHDNPTILRMLGDLSGIDVNKIDLGDADTMKIFTSPEILGVSPDQLRGLTDKSGRKYCPTGTLGIPELGTSFILGMLEETKPTTFAELIKISGLSHGTDVWLGNARDLCTPDEFGDIKVPFKDVIGCRDDIMVNLMQWGLPPSDSFKIMELVRKGKASKEPEKWAGYVKLMREYKVPEWYIESCYKIKYMFPKAHATAYVTSAFRIAWFKVHYPIFYYSAYFSIKMEQFDIVAMLGGYETIKNKIDALDALGGERSNKDNDVRETLCLCLEMTARGFYFKNIDLNISEAKRFVITEDQKGLIIPFCALDGLGESVALSIIKARNESPFISKEDLRVRGKVNNTAIENLVSLGVLDGYPESNQLTLF